MPYSPPSIGPAGLTLPSYDSIVEQLESAFRSIYGQSVNLDNDSFDHQNISVTALAISDAIQAIQLVWNNRSPATAIGSGLDAIVKLNGLLRKVPSFSTCQVVITGTVGTVILNGVVQDATFNQKWDLPPSVTIPGGGTITVTAVCEVLGEFALVPGTLTRIITPQSGWTGVNNTAPSIPGQPTESDSQLRARQSVSTELPSNTLLAGTVAGVLAVSGVTRINPGTGGVPSPIENPTSAVDVFGNPAHSISMVVDGGTDADVAAAIYANRGIGPFTNPNPGGAPRSGSTTVPVTDPFTGIVTNIGFARPTLLPIYVIVNAHLLSGGTSATIDAIKAAVISYLNSLQIGERISYAAVVSAVMSVNPDLTRPIVTTNSVFTGTAPAPTGVVDITINFWEVAQGLTANVTVNSV